MPAEQITITMDAEVAAQARRAAADAHMSLSEWMTRAAASIIADPHDEDFDLFEYLGFDDD
ncbi:MAG: hypothetical protein GEV07_24780 [Streptosporangiales bacterium]|nr:hypothetical protein [Streptosporangiales bacterium]